MRAINSVCNSGSLDGTWMAEHFEECGGDLELRSFLKQVYTFTSLLSWCLSGGHTLLHFAQLSTNPTKTFSIGLDQRCPFHSQKRPKPQNFKSQTLPIIIPYDVYNNFWMPRRAENAGKVTRIGGAQWKWPKTQNWCISRWDPNEIFVSYIFRTGSSKQFRKGRKLFGVF